MITTTLAELRRALAATGLVAPNRPAVPVLAGLLVEADNGRVTVSSYNYNTAVTVHLDATATRDMRFVIPYRFLARLLPPTGVPKLVRRVPKPERDRLPVTLDADPASATLAVNGHEIAAELMPVGDYPNLPEPTPAAVTVDRDTFADRLARVMTAVGGETSPDRFRSVQITVDTSGVRLAATDQYRAARALLPAPAVGAWSAAVHGRLLDRLVKHLPAGTLGLGAQERGESRVVTLAGGGITVITRAEEDVPTPSRPEDPSGCVTVHRERLADAVEVAEQIMEARDCGGHAVRLEINPGWVRVVPTVTAPGGRRTRLPELAALTTGVDADVVVGFSPRLLLDALGAVGGESVELWWRAPGRPVTVSGGVPGVEYLVMPVRLSQ